jgi:hypothetical protein
MLEKTTWSGCGNHLASALNSIPQVSRCTCTPQIEWGGELYPPKAGQGRITEKVNKSSAIKTFEKPIGDGGAENEH